MNETMRACWECGRTPLCNDPEGLTTIIMCSNSDCHNRYMVAAENREEAVRIWNQEAEMKILENFDGCLARSQGSPKIVGVTVVLDGSPEDPTWLAIDEIQAWIAFERSIGEWSDSLLEKMQEMKSYDHDTFVAVAKEFGYVARPVKLAFA